MKHASIYRISASLVCAAGLGQKAKTSAPTVASVVDGDMSWIEKPLLDIAEAMPEEKYNFSPESLNIPGAACQGERTFARQVKHIAASNYIMRSAITGDKFLRNDGPESLKTKAEIIEFLKDSFAQGHKAAAALSPESLLQQTEQSTRLHLAEYCVAHAFDHYGQMVEYLRMNGIVPPASR